MSETFKVACLQSCASADMAASVAEIEELAREAHGQGAALLCLPEFFSCLSVSGLRFETGAHAESDHPALARLRELAGELGV